LVVSLVLTMLGDPVKLPAQVKEAPTSESQEDSRPESKSEGADDLVLPATRAIRRTRRIVDLSHSFLLSGNGHWLREHQAGQMTFAPPLPLPTSPLPGAGVNLRC
jgi:hypothetical protein